jgi:hypothetical protein
MTEYEHECREGILYGGGETEHHLLGSCQTSSARPFGTSGTKIKKYKDVRMMTSVVRNRESELLFSNLMFFRPCITVLSYFVNQLLCTILYSITICLLHYYPRHVSSINMPILRRKDCIHTASGIFALCKRLHSKLVESGLSPLNMSRIIM